VGAPERAYLCVAQLLQSSLVNVMLSLSFVVYFFRRQRAFAWSPAVDLTDPYVAAALAPMTHS
jgi:hypothetical protein